MTLVDKAAVDSKQDFLLLEQKGHGRRRNRPVSSAKKGNQAEEMRESGVEIIPCITAFLVRFGFFFYCLACCVRAYAPISTVGTADSILFVGHLGFGAALPCPDQWTQMTLSQSNLRKVLHLWDFRCEFDA